jgi:hypothetical protein
MGDCSATGPLVWLVTNNQPYAVAFPWGSLWRAVFLAAVFPLAANIFSNAPKCE